MVSVENFVDSEHGVVITPCSGHVTRNDVMNSIASLRRNLGFRPNFRQLTNLMDGLKFDLDFKDLYGIRQIYDPFSTDSRRAIVAPQGCAGYGLARMYQAIVDGEHRQVFVSLTDAISWLGLDVTVLEAAIQRGRTSSRPRLEVATLLDLPPDVPQTFRPIRKKLRNAARQRKGYILEDGSLVWVAALASLCETPLPSKPTTPRALQFPVALASWLSSIFNHFESKFLPRSEHNSPGRFDSNRTLALA